MSTLTAPRRRSGLQPLLTLFEAPGLPAFALPDELIGVYDGSIGFTEPRLYANFVASVDGVTAIPNELQSSHLIAASSERDRFVMGLLRACADVILVGAGTLMASPRTRWTAEHAYPPAAPLYAELRRRRGRPRHPTLAVLTGSGRINPRHPGLGERSLILTSGQGAARVGRDLPPSAVIVPLGATPTLNPIAAIAALRTGGHQLILCEGGPTLFGALVAAKAVDELFLTLSPMLAGRAGGAGRLSLLEEAAFLPDRMVGCNLLSLRRAGSHLFLRYELPVTDPEHADALKHVYAEDR
jgi:riboflavin biosynthesis pyrimidine reductase